MLICLCCNRPQPARNRWGVRFTLSKEDIEVAAVTHGASGHTLRRLAHTRRVNLVLGVVIALRIALCQPVRADPPYIPITSELPPLPDTSHHDLDGPCQPPGSPCIQRTIAKMQQLANGLGQACDHNAVFAVTYLRVTQTFAWWIAQPGGFEDRDYLIQLDRAFALRYLWAYRDWRAGRRAQVPDAWKIAFGSADRRQVDGSGDALLAINAHVYEDLPFVLYQLGLGGGPQLSHKPDYDRVNAVFVETIDPLVAELASRFDPQIGLLGAAGQAGPAGFVALEAAAREDVWREAEELTDAPNALARSVVAGAIHRRAAAHASLMLATNAYHPPVTNTQGRDAFCLQHHNHAAPQPYRFGSA